MILRLTTRHENGACQLLSAPVGSRRKQPRMESAAADAIRGTQAHEILRPVGAHRRARTKGRTRVRGIILEAASGPRPSARNRKSLYNAAGERPGAHREFRGNRLAEPCRLAATHTSCPIPRRTGTAETCPGHRGGPAAQPRRRAALENCDAHADSSVKPPKWPQIKLPIVT